MGMTTCFYAVEWDQLHHLLTLDSEGREDELFSWADAGVESVYLEGPPDEFDGLLRRAGESSLWIFEVLLPFSEYRDEEPGGDEEWDESEGAFGIVTEDEVAETAGILRRHAVDDLLALPPVSGTGSESDQHDESLRHSYQEFAAFFERAADRKVPLLRYQTW